MAPEPYGTYVELGNIDQMSSNIAKIEKKSMQISDACRDYAIKNYDHERILKKVMSIINDNGVVKWKFQL